MKGYLNKLIFVLCIVSSLHLFPVQDARSQSAAAAPGGFQWGGGIELGYRFTDIDGSRDRYKETVNLMQGLRIFDLNLWGKNLEKNGWVDYFSLSGNGIGDPFPSARLQLKKQKTYDFTVTYKEYKYFFNRDDDTFSTDDHSFNQKRRMGAVTLALFPKEDIRLNLGYRHSERVGDSVTPVVFEDNHALDLKERLNDYFISADFPVGDWNFHVKQNFWTFENRDRISDSSMNEKPKSTVNTYVSTVKAHTQFGDRWDLDTGYIYAHSQGRGDLFSVPPVGDVAPGTAHFNSNIHIAELGLSHLLLTNLIAHLDYRFHVENTDGVSHTDEDVPKSDFNQVSHTGTFQLEYLPRENVTLRAGYRLQYRDINGDALVSDRSQGGEDSEDAKIWNHGWIASADWKPSKVFSVFGEYQGANFDNPYTRISPESENLAKVRIKYNTPIKNLTLKGTASWKRRRNPDQDLRVDVQDYTFTTVFQPALLPKLTVDGSFTYERIQDKKDIFNFDPFAFERFTFDSNAIIWTGGMTYEGIYKGLGARLNGSYAKTYKENSQRYADGAFSFWYKTKCLTPMITLERTYLHDHVRPRDSFDANLLTLSLRKDF
jgi:hypothetical protein